MVTLYTVYADDIPVYLPKDLWDDDYEGEKVTPTVANLIMEDNKSGSFEFSILPQHPAYDEIELITTTIKVTEYVYDDEGSLENKTILWKGRVISIEDSMDGIRTFSCEGALAFLNDIICYPTTNAIVSEVITSYDGYDDEEEMKNEALRRALQDHLDNGGNQTTGAYSHGGLFRNYGGIATQEFVDCIYTVGLGYNASCLPGREINIGKVTLGNVHNSAGFIDCSEDYDGEAWMFKGELSTPTAAFASTLDQILDVTVDLNGGHLRIRHTERNGTEQMYLDYLGDYNDSDSSAEYGVNIIEYSGKLELNSPVTDIIPRGAVKSTWNDNKNTETIVDTSQFYIGANVGFCGNYHYVASTSDQGYKCTPGAARITNLNFGSKHPIHLIHTGTDSTVYGWVNQSDVVISSSNTTTGFEFTGRQYESYPLTEYIGINPDGSNGLHVVNENLIDKYGHIQQIVDFPDISDAVELRTAAEEWLDTHSSFLKQSYEVSLVDLGHVYGSGEMPIHLLDRVHVYMPKHDIDEYMPVTKIEMDLLNPANTTISFSKETNRSAISTFAIRRAAAISDPSVELNQPNDSISQAMARQSKYISNTSSHATINTSVTQNIRTTLPDGETTNIDVEKDGNVVKMVFVNGLLSGLDGNNQAGGIPYDIFTDKYIKHNGVIIPANPYTQYVCNISTSLPPGGGSNRSMAYGILSDVEINISEEFRLYERMKVPPHPSSGSPGIGVAEYIGFNHENDEPGGLKTRYVGQEIPEELLIDEVTWKGAGSYARWVDVFPYPNYYTDSGPEAEELILNTAYGTKEYGLYYRLVDGERKYFPTPCIYYLPNNWSGDLYCMYVGPMNVAHGNYTGILNVKPGHPDLETHIGEVYGRDTNNKRYSVILTSKIKNLGKAGSTTVKTMLTNMFYDRYKARMNNDLLLECKKNIPSNTAIPTTNLTFGPSMALLMMPFANEPDWDDDVPRGNAGTGNPESYYFGTSKLFVCPVIVEESDSYRYIDGTYYPEKIKIYSGRNGVKVPIGYHTGSTYSGAYMEDMMQETSVLGKDDVPTTLIRPRFYVFSKKADMEACIEDYKSGMYTQQQIEDRHLPKIIAVNNTKNTTENQTKMRLSYTYNGRSTSYYVPGATKDPFPHNI